MIMIILLLRLKKELIKMADFTQDIIYCSACNKKQSRYLFVQENNKYICVACWLRDANNYRADKKVEENVQRSMKDYRTKYFSSNLN